MCLYRLISSVVVAAFVLVGCATAPSPAPSVYEQLGGEPAVRQIVEEFTWRMANDERVAGIFEFTDWAHFRAAFHEHICHVSGGGCDYNGMDMQKAHAGIGITHGEFNVAVENLQIAMTELGTPLAAQNRLLAVLAPMREDIVHR